MKNEHKKQLTKEKVAVLRTGGGVKETAIITVDPMMEILASNTDIELKRYAKDSDTVMVNMVHDICLIMKLFFVIFNKVVYYTQESSLFRDSTLSAASSLFSDSALSAASTQLIEVISVDPISEEFETIEEVCTL